MTLQNGCGEVPSRGVSQGAADNNNNNNNNNNGEHGAPRWDLSPDDIKTRTDDVIQRMKAAYDRIGSLDVEKVSAENTLLPLAWAKFNYAASRHVLDFPQFVSPLKAVRSASTEAEKKLAKFDVEISMRQDVFHRVIALQKKLQDNVTPEEKRFLNRIVTLGKRNGLHLSNEIQEDITRFSKQISGLADSYLNGLERTEDGRYEVTLEYPHYYPLMKRCHVPETRRRMELAFHSRCKEENTAILEQLIELRAKVAALLGFSSHADYVLELNMARNASNVSDFLDKLYTRLKPIGEKERKYILALKKRECLMKGQDFDGRINAWDLPYYMNQVEQVKFAVDKDKLLEYFPLKAVTRGLFAIYQELLGLTFTQVPEPHVWHESVDLYLVRDAETGDLIGQEGKYSHAACFGLQPGCVGPDGERTLAAAAMVANFTKPGWGWPSLLQHHEVETYFHEFGHVMHELCSKVETDFVEVPSQMLENWVWEESSLRRMSGHYKDGSPIPDALLGKLMASRGGPDATHRATGGHGPGVRLALPGHPGRPRHPSHLAGGYDGQYYGYLWSEVYSMDIFFSHFKKEGIMNPKIGRAYRRTILEPGGSVDGMDMLKKFLGREPREDAFFQCKGLGINSATVQS
ncbi:hypothetical protein CRUP_025402 [Coryphaenoides rupestris]|nr:hypothetical protein CRUP_025402 [Coryphaenoides rupestris]